MYCSGYVFSLETNTNPSLANNNQILLFAMWFGIINFVLALPAFYINTLGRKSLLLITFPFLALFQLITAIGLMLPHASIHSRNMVIDRIYLFSVAYSPSEGPVSLVYPLKAC